MGTWDASILGNDTSAEVYELFFERYNQGDLIEVIEASIAQRFASSLTSVEDAPNVLFARALAHWETGTLSEALLAEVVAAADGGAALAAYRSLSADDAGLRERSRVLARFVQKVGVPRPTARKRKKPPAALETKFVAGACLSYRRSTTEYGGVVVIDGAFFARRGEMCLAATNLAQARPPTFADFAGDQALAQTLNRDRTHGRRKASREPLATLAVLLSTRNPNR